MRLIVGLLFAGASANVAAAEKVRIVFATPVTQADVWERGEKAVLTRFMAENPDIEVVARNIPFESYDTQVLLSVRGGRPPDVARVNHSTLRTWAGAGYLQALDAFVAESKVVDPGDYWPGFWSICRLRGRLYALPLGTDCRVMVCNRKLLAEAGVAAPPRTWAELVHAAARIHRPDRKVYGVALPGHIEWAVAYDAIGNFLVGNGGLILDAEGTRSVLAENPAAVEAFRFACELTTRYRVTPPGAASLPADVIDALFVQDRLGIVFAGPWLRPNFRRLRPGFEWGSHYDLALMPAGPASGRSGSSQGGWLVAAFAGSKHPKEALKLLEFFSRPESLATVAAVECLPPRRASMAFEPFRDDAFYKVFFEQLEYARPPLACVPQLPNVARAIRRAYQRVISGGASVDETIRWLDDKLTNDLLR